MSIEKFENGKYKELKTLLNAEWQGLCVNNTVSFFCGDTLRYPCDIFCFSNSAGMDDILKEFGSPLTVKWDQTECIRGIGKCGDRPWGGCVMKPVSSGKFRVKFYYFEKKEENSEKIKCIEKEFVIK